MDNKKIKNEAERIANELIKTNDNSESLDTIIDKLIKKEFNKFKMNILIYVTKILSEKQYEIVNCNPFTIKKIQI